MKNNDWHEAYFDLVNKVECECVQQGDLVPIWDQFKAMSAELAKFKALAETLAGALEAAAYALHTISESSPDCMGWEPPYPSTVSTISVEAKAATAALRQYKEARDAS